MSDQTEEKSEKKPGKFKVILFALCVSIICSFLITATAIGLKDRQLDNMALDKKINILKAAGLVGSGNPGREVIESLFDTHIQEVLLDSQGQIISSYIPNALTFFFIKKDDMIQGYILPIITQGLWGQIKGYLAFENDGKTVSGFSVFNHSETPGLGGEIESAWFRRNFVGKRIINSENQFVSVGIAKGRVTDLPAEKQDHYVDGISGATLTGDYLAKGIKETLVKYDPISIKFRQRRLNNHSPPDENADRSIPITHETNPVKAGE